MLRFIFMQSDKREMWIPYFLKARIFSGETVFRPGTTQKFVQKFMKCLTSE